MVVFGYNAGSGYVDAGEQRKLAASSLHRFPVSSVRGHPQAAACEALACLPSHLARVLVHFDVDVIDGDEFAAADLPHRGGLALREAMEALRVFVQTPRFAGLVVTEFNPVRDPDLVFARRLVAGLADSFRGAPWA